VTTQARIEEYTSGAPAAPTRPERREIKWIEPDVPRGGGYWQRLAEERGIEIDRLRARIAELEGR
jgi:hypothetical protein